MTRFHSLLATALLGACLLSTSGAAAQGVSEEELYGERRSVESPERFALELRIGAYTPDVGNAFSIFNGDIGPWIGAEFDVMIARIPYVGLFGVGAAFGWVHYTGSAFLAGSSTSVTEETTLTLFPLSALAVLRVDVLARELRIPFLFTGKLGGDAILWDSNTGSRNVANNVSWGLHWAAQAALELDFLDPGSARTLDSEWGINHSFAFFELFGTTADSTLRLAPKNGFAWSAGLGFIF